jgi:probable phosphoglycerate mutase
MTMIVLVRHGETEHNRGQITLGQADVPLNALGRMQARAIAASFIRPPVAIYTSPLLRCRDVAEGIARATGVDVIVEPALIEMDVGEMEHLTREELREKHGDFLRVWLSGEAADARMPGGETLREVQDRAWDALERIAVAHAGKEGDVVAVAHSFVICTSVCRAIGLPLSGFRRVRAQVGSKTTIEIGEHGSALVGLNERGHLVRGS